MATTQPSGIGPSFQGLPPGGGGSGARRVAEYHVDARVRQHRHHFERVAPVQGAAGGGHGRGQGRGGDLTGVIDLGQSVNLTAVTGADGSYSFIGLRAGTYSLMEVGQVGGPDPYGNGTDNVGTLGGTVNTDVFSNIYLNAGVAGLNYNFGETLLAGS